MNDTVMTGNVASGLAALVCRTTFADFPAATVDKTKLHILDTLGVALAGSSAPETRMALEAMGLAEEGGCVPVWGSGLRLAPRSAAFVNAVAAHAYELDDCGGCDHSGAVVLPAALAALSLVKTPVDGRKLLLAVLMGYEVGRRVLEAAGGYETHNGLGWHSTGTCGVFGAAAAAGVLLDLGPAALASAFGIACSFAGGTWAFIHDGSQTKKLHCGHAAEGGLSAARLAAGGFRGPTMVFDDGRWGSFNDTLGRGGTDTALLTSAFGARWRLDRCSIKPYATCRGTHSAIDAVERVLAKGTDPGHIAAIEVAMSGFQNGMCGGKALTSRAQAQMSLPYAVAARLQFGRVFLDELEESAWSSGIITPWLDRIAVHVDPAMQDEAEPVLAFVLRDGRRLVESVASPLGSPDHPLPPHKVVEKFRRLAHGVLGPARSRQLEDHVLALDARDDAKAVAALLGREPA